MDLCYFRRLFIYDDWANREALRSLEATPAVAARGLQVMAHIAATQWVWMDRLLLQAQRCAVWPAWSLQEIAAQLEALRGSWAQYLGSVGDGGLATSMSYTNTKGEKFTNTVADVLTHVAMHGVYHRGQIAAAVRATGGTPAYTDYIQAVRTGKASG